MNDQIIKGKWAEFKGEVRKAWGELTDNDLEQTKGNVTAIGGLIQQRYGQVKDDVSAKLNELAGRYADKAVDKTEDVKQTLRDSNDRSSH